MTPNVVTWKDIKVCRIHRDNSGLYCLSCKLAIDWNVWRQVCACGAPARGYRTLALDARVEFFCDEHFQPVPRTKVSA